MTDQATNPRQAQPEPRQTLTAEELAAALLNTVLDLFPDWTDEQLIRMCKLNPGGRSLVLLDRFFVIPEKDGMYRMTNLKTRFRVEMTYEEMENFVIQNL